MNCHLKFLSLQNKILLICDGYAPLTKVTGTIVGL
jgi:hypothetical protein